MSHPTQNTAKPTPKPAKLAAPQRERPSARRAASGASRRREGSGARAGEIPLSEIAARLEVTVQAAGMWARRPGAPVRVEGRRVYVRARDFLRWREAELVRRAVAESQPTVGLEEARIRKTLADAERSELELAVARGQLVTVEDFGRALGRLLDRVSARVRALPVRLSGFGAEVESEAEREAEVVLGELRELEADLLPDVPVEAGDDTDDAGSEAEGDA